MLRRSVFSIITALLFALVAISLMLGCGSPLLLGRDFNWNVTPSSQNVIRGADAIITVVMGTTANEVERNIDITAEWMGVSGSTPHISKTPLITGETCQITIHTSTMKPGIYTLRVIFPHFHR